MPAGFINFVSIDVFMISAYEWLVYMELHGKWIDITDTDLVA